MRRLSILLLCLLTLFSASAENSLMSFCTPQADGSLLLSLSCTELIECGFTYGDLVAVTAGGEHINLPIGSAPEQDDGRSLLVLDEQADIVTITRMEPVDAVRITLQASGSRYSEWAEQVLQRTDARADYPELTDEGFANFREVIPGVLYRSSSPVNPRLARSAYADRAAREAGIRTVLDLADSRKKQHGYSGYQDTYISEIDSICLDLSTNCTTDEFARRLAGGLRQLIESDGPYLVHCNEGKTRAGFVCAILECLAGFDGEAVLRDYMLTYQNYYGIPVDSEMARVIASHTIIPTLRKVFGVEELSDCDLSAEARAYLSSAGMSDTELDTLITILR